MQRNGFDSGLSNLRVQVNEENRDQICLLPMSADADEAPTTDSSSDRFLMAMYLPSDVRK